MTVHLKKHSNKNATIYIITKWNLIFKKSFHPTQGNKSTKMHVVIEFEKIWDENIIKGREQ